MKNVFNVVRKIVGIMFMIAGLIGTLIPIPLVPFFLLFFIGLGIYGIEKEKIEKIKNKIKHLNKK